MAWDNTPYTREDNGECDDCCNCECTNDDRCGDCLDCCAPDHKHVHKSVHGKSKWGSTKQEGENKTMNSTIIKLYPATADAVLVNKFYGHIIKQSDIEVITLKGKEKDILEAAKGKQAKEDACKNVVTARITA